MKILFGTRTYLILFAVAILATLSLRVFAQSPFPTPTEPPVDKGPLILKIKKATSIKVSDSQFEDMLKHLSSHAQYDIVIDKGDGSTPKHVVSGAAGAKLDIKTDRVVVSDIAQHAPGSELTLIQTRVTQQVASTSPSDLTTVIGTLQ
jgi:hypothetical protein